MNLNELKKYITKADAKGLTKAAESLTEQERKKFSKDVQQIYNKLDAARFKNVSGDRSSLIDSLKNLPGLIKSFKVASIHSQFNVASLAVLAFCPISFTKKIGGRSYDYEDFLIKILLDRKPDWILQWVEQKLSGEWIDIRWNTVRTLVQENVCPKPEVEGYYQLMVQDLLGTWGPGNNEKYVPLSEKLKKEPDILDNEIWKLFEFETSAFTDNWDNGTYQHLPENYESWSTAVCKLSQEGLIDRDRLLSSSLDGLTTGFKNNTLSGYVKLHEKLKPELEELVSRQEIYLDLLSNQASQVVTFSLKMLKTLEKKKKLDIEAFINSAGSVFLLDYKSQPAAVLKLLEKFIKSNPENIPVIKQLAMQGLTHSSPDVQEQALKILENTVNQKDRELIEQIQSFKDDVTASLHSRIDSLIKASGIDSKSDFQEIEPIEIEDLRQELHEQITNLSDDFKKLIGLDCQDLCTENSLPGPMHFNIMDVPILQDLSPIKPIENIEELIDSVAHAIETVENPDEVERIISGIAHMCNKKEGNFDRLSAPLIKRIEKIGVSDVSDSMIGNLGTHESLKSLLVAWLKNGTYKYESWYKPAGPLRFIIGRVTELSRQVIKNEPVSCLSLPTHSGGWLDPIILVERILQAEEQGLNILKYDLIQALLRMAPDNRYHALQNAEKISGNYGRLIRWALGAEDGPTKKDNKLSSLWLAAGRARTPYDDILELECLKLPDLPDSIKAASISWKSGKKSSYDKYSKKTYYFPLIEIDSILQKPEETIPSEFPTVLLHLKAGMYDYLYGAYRPWVMYWVRTVWPQNLNPYFSASNTSLVTRLDDPAVSMIPNFMALDPLYEVNRHLSEQAYLLLCLGLLGRDNDVKGHTIDVMVETIQDARFHPDPFVKVLIKLSKPGWAKLNRLAENLREVARLSNVHCLMVALILDMFLAAQEKLPKDIHYLFSLQNDLVNRLGISLTDEAKSRLEGLKGSTKTAKLGKALLNYVPSEQKIELEQARLQYIKARLERTNYWRGF